ncbi:hypothetical protein J6590_006691 [Homalodisca vitripennis]|nr:hypothetical protein J6590_006691 [Homalodisca vitripennis]
MSFMVVVEKLFLSHVIQGTVGSGRKIQCCFASPETKSPTETYCRMRLPALADDVKRVMMKETGGGVIIVHEMPLFYCHSQAFELPPSSIQDEV